MPPAARLTNMHTCPMVTPGTPPVPHVGGPITGPGIPTVLIGGMPAATLGDMATCVGPPDSIVKGSTGVMIGGKPAARVGDVTAHGGVISVGLPTVLIGEAGAPAPSAGAPGMAASASGGAATSTAESNVDQAPSSYGEAIIIEGDASFREATVKALKQIDATPSGKKLLASLDKHGKTVTIKPTSGGNKVTGFTKDAFAKADGSPGKGSASTVSFNPDKSSLGSADWQKRPAGVGLAHELIHAEHAAAGTIATNKVKNDAKPDPSDPSRPATAMSEEVRTVGLEPFEDEPFTENAIRSEWDPKQPPRPWY